jgi:hypothetical protein
LRRKDANMLSERSRMPLARYSQDEQYNLSFKQSKADKSRENLFSKFRQNQPNFRRLGNLSEEEKIEILQSFRNYGEWKIC